MANSTVIGPFPVPFDLGKAGGKYISEDLTNFWNDCGKNIENGIGCYIFGMRAGKGFTPIYIGKTIKSFSRECFAEHKVNRYNNALKNYKKGTPVMFFVLHSSKSDNGKKEIGEIENYLIHIGYLANNNIKNVRKTKGPSWGIDGVIRSHSNTPSDALKSFLKMMNLKTSQTS